MDSKIPEVERAVGNQRSIHRSNVAMLVIVGLACLIITVGALVLFIKVDGKVSHIETSTGVIRSTQIANTNRIDCQNRGFNALLDDTALAFAGDKNPDNYKRAVKC